MNTRTGSKALKKLPKMDILTNKTVAWMFLLQEECRRGFPKPPLRFVWNAMVVLWLCPSVAMTQTRVTCTDCHSDQANELADSVHHTIACAECHGGPGYYEQVDPDSGVSAGFDHGPSFIGKPSRAEVPSRCGTCHADVRRMNPYGLRTDQLSRYLTSGHGLTLTEKGDMRVAVCTDCHGSHNVMPSDLPSSKTYPANIPQTCGTCHEQSHLMAEFDLPAEIVDEYRQSVHGDLLLKQHDHGAPHCATCHGNHAAAPPGFGSVGAVCGRCHQHAEEEFSKSIHAKQEGFHGCVQCHGGGENRHFHLIERITQPPGIMISRYAHLLRATSEPTSEEVAKAIHPDRRGIIDRVLPTCYECHEDIEEDESLPGLFEIFKKVDAAEQRYVETANRLDEMAHGVLLVENQLFKFQDAKTHLIALAPTLHTLNNELVAEKAAELDHVCRDINAELDELEEGLSWRYRSLWYIWAFAVVFGAVLYAYYVRLKRRWVSDRDDEPIMADNDPSTTTRRGFLDAVVMLGSSVAGLAVLLPSLMYLWPAAKGGGSERVEVPGADELQPGGSKKIQVGGKAIIVVRTRDGYRAFSAVCTHLGCLVTWNGSRKEFLCPCHAAAFDESGQVISGPPSGPLPEYAVKVVGGKVFVTQT